MFAVFGYDLWLLLGGTRLNMNIPSYQYRYPHVKDKTVSQPSYL